MDSDATAASFVAVAAAVVSMKTKAVQLPSDSLLTGSG